jgi:hypothetical protein
LLNYLPGLLLGCGDPCVSLILPGVNAILAQAVNKFLDSG